MGQAGREDFGGTPLWIGARREVWDGRGRPVNRRRREYRLQPAEILFCDAPPPASWAWARTSIPPSRAEERGWSIQRRSLQAGRGDAGLDQVQQDPLDLGRISDDGKHLHRRAAAAAAKGVHLVEFGQQPRPTLRSTVEGGT